MRGHCCCLFYLGCSRWSKSSCAGADQFSLCQVNTFCCLERVALLGQHC